MLVVLEGVDGAGTSTQTELLAQHLAARGKRVSTTREPSDRRVGVLIRKLLAKDAEPIDPRALALLFAADRLDHVVGEIEPASQAGIVVISDRYVWSSLVYQTLALPREEVEAWNRYAPPAALTVLLTLPPDIAAKRRKLRGGPEEIFDDLEVQKQLAAGYARELVMAAQRGERVVEIDASPPIAEVAKRIARAVDSVVDA